MSFCIKVYLKNIRQKKYKVAMMHFCIFTSMRQLLIYIEACHFHLLSSRNKIFNKCHSNNAFKLRHFMGSQLCIFLPILELRFKYAKDFLLIFWTILQIWRNLFFPLKQIVWSIRYGITMWFIEQMRNFLVTQRHWGSTYNFLESLQIRSGRNLNLFVSKKLDKYLLAVTKNKYF